MRANAEQHRIVAGLDALKRLQSETAAELDALLPATDRLSRTFHTWQARRTGILPAYTVRMA